MTENIAPPVSRSAPSPEWIDLLATFPSTVPFIERVRQLNLNPVLEQKVFRAEYRLAQGGAVPPRIEALTVDDEKELATEVLLRRHRFTEMLLVKQQFRQAVLTVVQNIYLFRNRKIFFANTTRSAESERQEALVLFSTGCKSCLPLEKTLQHLIVARVWNRILGLMSRKELQDNHFVALHAVVEQLNTLRNIYMLLSTGLVRKLAAKTNTIYRESVTYEDAVQIGEIGVARAAYRYHQSCGVRFSTFAANWIFKEIQRQALEGRLIRISTNTVEGFTKAAKSGNSEGLKKYAALIAGATATEQDLAEIKDIFQPDPSTSTIIPSPSKSLEESQRRNLLLSTIDERLSQKSGDIIKRRYGLPPYQGQEQSIIAISKKFGVTRSSIYQLEQSALRKLQKHLDRELL